MKSHARSPAPRKIDDLRRLRPHNHRCASTARLDITILALMMTKTASFMHSPG
jgi:hypothetical protein